jgi:acetyl esterase/lipase
MSLTYRARLARRFIAEMSSGSAEATDEQVFGLEQLARARTRMDQVDRLPRPRRVDYVDTTVGGIPAIVATPTADGYDPPTRHLLYVHGGAYVLGSPRSHIAMAARLARLANATATVIDYRLAPEHVYPAAIDDCVAAYRALAAEVDPSTITIAGDSAGGGATLSTLCAIRDAGDRVPGAAYLLSPWVDLTGSGESVATRAHADPMIDGSRIATAGRVYAGDLPLDHPGVSPLFADLRGLPPMLIQTGMDEVLLSDSTRLAEKARTAGVDVTLDLAEGMWHVYQGFARFVPEATEALVRAAVFMRSRTSVNEPSGAPA